MQRLCYKPFKDIDDPYAQICVSDNVKYLNVTIFFVQHELCQSKCRLNGHVCNSKEKWNHDKCRCECKKSINQISCKKSYMWNLSTCDCGYDKTFEIGEYLDIKNVDAKIGLQIICC